MCVEAGFEVKFSLWGYGYVSWRRPRPYINNVWFCAARVLYVRFSEIGKNPFNLCWGGGGVRKASVRKICVQGSLKLSFVDAVSPRASALHVLAAFGESREVHSAHTVPYSPHSISH